METAYEAIFIVDTQLPEEQVGVTIEKYTALITREGGEIDDVDRMEPRRLAYPIKGHREGQHILVNFRSEPAVKDELDRIFRISDDVLRYLIIKQDKRADRFPSRTRASEYERREREQAARSAASGGSSYGSAAPAAQPVTELSASAPAAGVENANGVTDGHENVTPLPPADVDTLEATAPEAEQELGRNSRLISRRSSELFNRIILIGRLTRDPEAKYTPSGVPVTSFSIAVDRPQSSEARQQGREKETDFIDIVTWRQTAEFAANYLQKGRMVVVEGKLQIRSFVTQDGQQRKAAEVVADNVRGLDRPREGGEGGEGEGVGYAASRPAGGGGYSGNSSGGYGGGGGNAPATRPPAPNTNRPPARPAAPAPTGDSYDDMDDLADPFAE